MNSYFEHPAMSQSKLKGLLISSKVFTEDEVQSELYFEEKKHFIVGSAVDYCLTQPTAEFSDVYHISTLENKPSDTIKSIINMVFDKAVEIFEGEVGLISDHYSLILNSCEEHSYQVRWNDDTRVNKVAEHYEYWEDLKAARGKIVLSQEEATLIDSIVMSLRSNEVTSQYFTAEGVEFQKEIHFTVKDIDCKALLDIIIVDDKSKTIQPIDLKTIGDYVTNFPKSLRRRRYDIQAAFYTEALKQEYPGYRILPFKFIVESTTNVGSPLVFTCSNDILYIGKYGRPTLELTGVAHPHSIMKAQRFEAVKGFIQLIELYKYHLEHGFEVDKDIRDNNFEMTMDWNGVVI